MAREPARVPDPMLPMPTPCSEVNDGTPPPGLYDWVARRLAGVAPAAEWVALAGGRTNRLWRLEASAGAVIVKLYVPGMASRLFPNGPSAEHRALTWLAGDGLAPAPLVAGRCAAGPVLCYRAVEGHAPAGVAGAAALGRTLGRLHRHARGPVTFRRVGTTPRALSRGILADLDEAGPGPATQRLRALASRARDARTGPKTGERVTLLHGDPVPGNALVAPGCADAVLIDWQCPGLGDPVHDLGLALSPGMRGLYGAAALTDEERAAFWSAYGDPVAQARHAALAPLLSARIAAHFMAQASRGRPGYAAAAAVELAALEE